MNDLYPSLTLFTAAFLSNRPELVEKSEMSHIRKPTKRLGITGTEVIIIALIVVTFLIILMLVL